MTRRRPPRPSDRGFTLIEVVAVLLILGFMAALALPNLKIATRRVLEDQARRVAADLEFLRARAVMTGAPHRARIDLETMHWRLEWERSAEDETMAASADPLDPRAPLDLSPPAAARGAWQPIPGPMGNAREPHDDVFFDGIETPAGWAQRGEVEVRFEPDGLTDPTWIVLADDRGNSMTLELEPLADAVRFERGSL